MIEFGFFKNLKDFMENRASNKISDKMRLDLNEDTYLQLMTEKISKDMEKPIWINHFQNEVVLTNPQQEDIETVHAMHDCQIIEFLRILIYALREFSEMGLETSFECLMLHEYYKLLKTEAKNRVSLKEFISPQDSYVEWCKNKTTNQAQTQQLAHTRLTGKVCVHCGSLNVKSNGNMWTCRDCKKSFRKHY